MTTSEIQIGKEYEYSGMFVKVVRIDGGTDIVVESRTGDFFHTEASELFEKRDIHEDQCPMWGGATKVPGRFCQCDCENP